MYNIAEIKSVLTSDLVCSLLGLQETKNEIKHAGKTTFILCPDHDDKNPNSCVLTDHGYNCFACGSFGSSIDLYAKKKKLSFSCAVNHLGKLLKLKESNETFEPSPLTEVDKEALGLDSMQYLKKLWITNKEAYYYALNKKIKERLISLNRIYEMTDRSHPDFKKLNIYNSDTLFKIRSTIENYLIHIKGMVGSDKL